MYQQARDILETKKTSNKPENEMCWSCLTLCCDFLICKENANLMLLAY